MLRREEKRQDQYQWYPDSQHTENFWIYRMQNESATACIVSFGANCCVEKKKDKINTNSIQTASSQKNFGSTECKISCCVDEVICGEMLRREKKGQDQHQWYPDSQQTETFWIYRMQNQLLRGLCLLWLNVA